MEQGKGVWTWVPKHLPSQGSPPPVEPGAGRLDFSPYSASGLGLDKHLAGVRCGPLTRLDGGGQATTPESKGVLCSGRVMSSAIMLPVGGNTGEGGKLQSGFCAFMKHGSEVEKVRPKQFLQVRGDSKLQGVPWG